MGRGRRVEGAVRFLVARFGRSIVSATPDFVHLPPTRRLFDLLTRTLGRRDPTLHTR